MRRFRPEGGFWLRIAAVSLVAVALLLGGTLPAQAHATYLRSEPPDNSVLAESPSVIQIWFSEPIAFNFSSAQLLDLKGKPVQPISLQFTPDDRTMMALTPPKLPDGVYTVNWRVTAASDGHVSNGVFVFRVGAGSGGAGGVGPAGELSSTGSESQPLSIPETVIRWLNYFGLLAMMGAAAIPLLVLRGEGAVETQNIVSPRLSEPVGGTETQNLASLQVFYRRAAKRSYTLGALAAAFTFAVGLVYLVWQIGSLAPPDSPLGAGQAGSAPLAGLDQMLTGTAWGYSWIARQAIAAALIPLFSALAWAPRPSRPVKWLAPFLVAAALAAQSLSSHAAGAADPTLPVLADWLHLVFVGLWVGGLFALSLSVLPIIRFANLDYKTVARATWGRFGPLAALSVGVVIATGVYALGQRVISADALLLTEYGQLLAVKIGLVLLAGLVGLTNSLSLHQALSRPLARLLKKPAGWTPISLSRSDDRDASRSRLPALVLVEMGLGIGIALAAGALTTLAPATDLQYTIAPASQPDSLTKQVDDLSVDLSIQPNLPGQNLVNLLSSSSRRPAPAEVLQVIVRMTYLEQDFGTLTADALPAGADDYRVSLDALTQPGRWRIDVMVRRKGLPDSVASFDWTVLPLQALPPVIVSRSPWRDGLSLLAGLLALGVAGVFAVVWLRPRFVPPLQPQPAEKVDVKN